jgi:hypothetical protein
MLWHNENQQSFSWLGADWGARGGLTARELALWATLQREYRARGLLPGEALTRFEAIGVQWDAPVRREGQCLLWCLTVEVLKVQLGARDACGCWYGQICVGLAGWLAGWLAGFRWLLSVCVS